MHDDEKTEITVGEALLLGMVLGVVGGAVIFTVVGILNTYFPA